MQVMTTKGLLDSASLSVQDIVTDEDNARVTATEWRHEGELVRRDVNVNILRGINLTNEQEHM